LPSCFTVWIRRNLKVLPPKLSLSTVGHDAYARARRFSRFGRFAQNEQTPRQSKNEICFLLQRAMASRIICVFGTVAVFHKPKGRRISVVESADSTAFNIARAISKFIALYPALDLRYKFVLLRLEIERNDNSIVRRSTFVERRKKEATSHLSFNTFIRPRVLWQQATRRRAIDRGRQSRSTKVIMPSNVSMTRRMTWPVQKSKSYVFEAFVKLRFKQSPVRLV